MQDGNNLKTEKELIYKCKKDLDNFSEIYETYAKDVFRYVYIILKDKSDTEDIVSETFLIALKKIKRFSWQGISIKFWLFGIARNLIKQKKVNLSNISFNEDMKINETDEIGLEECIIRDEEKDTIKRLLLKLDGVSREIFALRIWEELSFKEIAQLLEIKEASARKIYSRGILKIKKLYEDERRKDIRLKVFTSGMLLFSIKRIEDLLNFIPNSEFNNITNKIQSNLILNIKKYNMQDIQNPKNLGQEVTKAAAVNTVKTKIIYTGIAILTIVAVGGGIGGYVYLESKDKDKEKEKGTEITGTTTTQTTTDTTGQADPYEGWKTYELEELDLGIKLPDSWTFKDESGVINLKDADIKSALKNPNDYKLDTITDPVYTIENDSALRIVFAIGYGATGTCENLELDEECYVPEISIKILNKEISCPSAAQIKKGEGNKSTKLLTVCEEAPVGKDSLWKEMNVYPEGFSQSELESNEVQLIFSSIYELDKEGWKKVELPKMGYQVSIPNEWEVKEELDSAGQDYQAVFTDDKDNNYYISSMCQLGDCGICEYKTNSKVLYTITFLGKSNTKVEVVDCYNDPVEIDKGEVSNRTIYFNADSLEGKFSNLSFGVSIEDTETSLEELQDKYKDLKKILESFEVL